MYILKAHHVPRKENTAHHHFFLASRRPLLTGDWIDDNMRDWLNQALYGRPWSTGWGNEQDAVYQSEQRQQKACNHNWLNISFTREDYVSADMRKFIAMASPVLTW